MIPYLFLQGILVASVTALPVLEQLPLGLAVPESNSQSDGGIYLEKSRRLHGRFLHITGKINSIAPRLRSIRGRTSKTSNGMLIPSPFVQICTPTLITNPAVLATMALHATEEKVRQDTLELKGRTATRRSP